MSERFNYRPEPEPEEDPDPEFQKLYQIPLWLAERIASTGVSILSTVWRKIIDDYRKGGYDDVE